MKKKVEVVNDVLVADAVVEAEGVTCVAVPCKDYEQYRTLPPAISHNGVICGKTGWNSDMGRAHYASDAKLMKVESFDTNKLTRIRNRVHSAHRSLKKMVDEFGGDVANEIRSAYDDLVIAGQDLGMWDEGNYREIREADVGKALFYAFGRQWPVSSFIGRIFPEDVGKRVYHVKVDEHEYILQVENDQQRAKRLKRK